jgi:hypothetical protein
MAAPDLPVDSLRQSVLQYVPLTTRSILALRCCSSSWRSSLECSTAYVQRPSHSDVVVSANGKSAIVALRGEMGPHVSSHRHSEVTKPKRTVLIAPALVCRSSDSAGGFLGNGFHMTERQLYRIFHVIETIVLARPLLDLRVEVDYRGWSPRCAEGSGLSIAGFSDPDTVASITPQQLISLGLGATTPLDPVALGSMLAGCYQLATLTIEDWCDDSTLSVIARSLPKLASLTVRRAQKLSDMSLQFSSAFLTRLKFVEICECPQVTDKGLTALVRGSADALRHIKFTFCERMTDLTLTQIAASTGRNLLTLDVSGNTLITSAGILLLFTDHCKLEEMHVNFILGALDADVLEAVLEFGWTVAKISAAFSHAEMGCGMPALIQKLRTRGTDIMC